MTKIVEELLKQLKDKSYKVYRTKADGSPILYPVDVFGFHIGNNEKIGGYDGGNITPNYKRVMVKGFDVIRQELVQSIEKAVDENKIAYGELMLEKLDNVLAVCDQYRETVKENERLYNALKTVPRKPATNFFEACLFIKICIYFLRIGRVGHIGLGRFDQYMYSFYQSDKNNGVSD